MYFRFIVRVSTILIQHSTANLLNFAIDLRCQGGRLQLLQASGAYWLTSSSTPPTREASSGQSRKSSTFDLVHSLLLSCHGVHDPTCRIALFKLHHGIEPCSESNKEQIT